MPPKSSSSATNGTLGAVSNRTSEPDPSLEIDSSETVETLDSLDDVEIMPDQTPDVELSVPAQTSPQVAGRQVWPALAIGLGVLLATTVGGYLLAAQGPDVWAADSQVRVRIAPEIAFADADRLLQTERLRIESFGLLQPVADELNTSVEDLRESVSAEPILGSEVLEIRVESRNAERALEMNAAVTSAFVTAINESDLALGSAKLDSQRAQLEADFEAAASRLEIAEMAYVSERADVPEEQRDEVTRSQLDLASTELDRVSGQLRDITSEQRQLDIRNSTTRGADVITPSYVLREPVAPTPLTGAAAGALIGLVIAAAIVAVLLRTGRSTNVP